MDSANKSYIYSAIPSWKPLNSVCHQPAGDVWDVFVLALPVSTWDTGCDEF